MTLDAENIFDLSQPDAYDCFIERYQSSFQVLRIRAESAVQLPPDIPMSIEFVFAGVLYYEGILNWTGASICIASREDCLATLQQAQLVSDDKDEIAETLETYHLFVIDTLSNAQIKFISHRDDHTMTIMG